MPDKKPDQYNEKVRKFFDANWPTTPGEGFNEKFLSFSAAFGRQCADEARREAFLEAAGMMLTAMPAKVHDELLALARASSSGKTGENNK